MKTLLTIAFCLTVSLISFSQKSKIEAEINKDFPYLEKLYQHLHTNPELSLQEEKTAARMTEELRSLGFEVKEKIGGHGIVGILTNGKGPTLLLRTDMDALPLEEKTGLSFASQAKGINAAGNETFVMHACGHDLHMTVFVGTARWMAANKNLWKGTLVMVGQPAEENGLGAAAMFEDGLYDMIPTPDFAVALHDNAALPAGTLGYRIGPLMASVDMMDITVFGEGGHGALPHTTKDPVVLAAQMVMAFQTIVSREISAIEPAVVTVGSIHGGTVHNIIPDQVKLQLTLRSYSPEVREQTIAAIHRISTSLAQGAGLPEDKMPVISIREPYTPATINDAKLTTRVVSVLEKNFGKDKVVETPLNMVGEDFSRFGMQEKKVPICLFWLGAVEPKAYQESMEKGTPLPSLHSPFWAPDLEPSVKTGVSAMVLIALDLMKK
jgi:amidohydrolase